MSEWRDIPGYEGLYQITREGSIRSLDRMVKNGSGMRARRGQVMKTRLLHGYEYVTLIKNKKCRNERVHRLLALTFIPRADGKDFINHKNGIKNDNCIENLEWCTIAENTRHAYEMGKITPPMTILKQRKERGVNA